MWISTRVLMCSRKKKFHYSHWEEATTFSQPEILSRNACFGQIVALPSSWLSRRFPPLTRSNNSQLQSLKIRQSPNFKFRNILLWFKQKGKTLGRALAHTLTTWQQQQKRKMKLWILPCSSSSTCDDSGIGVLCSCNRDYKCTVIVQACTSS